MSRLAVDLALLVEAASPQRQVEIIKIVSILGKKRCREVHAAHLRSVRMIDFNDDPLREPISAILGHQEFRRDVCTEVSGPARIRTWDQRIMSPLL